MKCKETVELLDDYILGELTPEIEIQLNDHLYECETCKKRLHEKEAIIAGLKKTTKFEPSIEALRRIKVLLPKKHVTEPTFLFFPRKRFAYALTAFILGLILMRSLDILFFKQKEIPQTEIKYETRHQEPFVDTVEFYHAPAKNVAKI